MIMYDYAIIFSSCGEVNLMDKSKDYFLDEVDPDSYQRLAKAFFKDGYDLTTTEAAELLDVTERYLVDFLKDHFDYVMAPRFATKCFKSHFTILHYSQELQAYSEHVRKNIALGLETFDYDNYFKGLMKKRIFINRETFKKFLLRDLKLQGSKQPYKRVTKAFVDSIMNREVFLYSHKSLKELNGHTFDKQTYRYIEREGLRRVYLTTISTDNPVVRFTD